MMSNQSGESGNELALTASASSRTAGGLEEWEPGRMICWISGAVQDRYVVYDAEEVETAERKAIDAYAGLPMEERK